MCALLPNCLFIILENIYNEYAYSFYICDVIAYHIFFRKLSHKLLNIISNIINCLKKMLNEIVNCKIHIGHII